MSVNKINKIDDEWVIQWKSKENIWFSHKFNSQFWNIWEANAKPWDESWEDENFILCDFRTRNRVSRLKCHLYAIKNDTLPSDILYYTPPNNVLMSYRIFVTSTRSQSEIESPYKSFIAFYVVIWDGHWFNFIEIRYRS